MSVEVSCPKCHTALRAPGGMAGKKARCKRCQTSFRIPGPVPAGDSVGDGVQLSVSDSPTPAAVAAAGDNPFAFDAAPPAARPVDHPTPLPATDDPFALPAAATPAEPKSAVRPRPAEKSKSKYRVKAADPDAPAAAPSGGRRVILVAGLVGLLCAAGGGAGMYFWLQSQNKPAAQANPTPADKPVPADPQPAEKAGPTAAKVEPAAKATGTRAPDQRTAKAAVGVTGGLKLPPGPTGTGMIVQKPKTRVPLDVEPGKVRRVLVSGADAGVVAVVWPSFAGFKGAGAVDTIDRYSLNSGKRIDRQEVSADGVSWPRACDLSPDGNRLATETPAGKLTVWDLTAKAKLLDGVDPYKDDGKGPSPGIAAVYFADDDKLAVVSKLGAVDVWDLKAKARAIAGSPIEGVTADVPLADRRTVAITPDRKAVLAYAKGTVYEVPLGTGKAKAALTLPRGPDAGYALAADASGARVVVAYRAMAPGPHTVVAVARLGDEKPGLVVALDADTGIPVAADWPAAETAVVVTDKESAALVIDAEAGRVVAAVRPAAAPAVQHPGASGELHWCVVPDPADAKRAVLVGVPLPFEGYFQLRDAAKEPVGLVLGAEGLGK